MGSCTLLYRWTGRVNGWSRTTSLDGADEFESVIVAFVKVFQDVLPAYYVTSPCHGMLWRYPYPYVVLGFEYPNIPSFSLARGMVV